METGVIDRIEAVEDSPFDSRPIRSLRPGRPHEAGELSRDGRREFRAERVDMDEVLASITATVTHRAVELGARI